MFVENVVQEGDKFASKIVMDPTGEYLFVTAPKAQDNLRIGKVLVFKEISKAPLHAKGDPFMGESERFHY